MPKMSPKIPPKAPYEGHDMEKKNIPVTLKRNTKSVCTKFHRTTERFSKSRSNIPKLAPKHS